MTCQIGFSLEELAPKYNNNKKTTSPQSQTSQRISPKNKLQNGENFEYSLRVNVRQQKQQLVKL